MILPSATSPFHFRAARQVGLPFGRRRWQHPTAAAVSPWGALRRSPPPRWSSSPSLGEEDKEETPLIIEGDIAIDPREEVETRGMEKGISFNALFAQAEFRLGIRRDRHPSRLWPNNTVPYLISDEYGEYVPPEAGESWVGGGKFERAFAKSRV